MKPNKLENPLCNYEFWQKNIYSINISSKQIQHWRVNIMFPKTPTYTKKKKNLIPHGINQNQINSKKLSVTRYVFWQKTFWQKCGYSNNISSKQMQYSRVKIMLTQNTDKLQNKNLIAYRINRNLINTKKLSVTTCCT